MPPGGLGMRHCGFGWGRGAAPPTSAARAAAFGPYYLWYIEQFGVDCCVFENNFPVAKVSYAYAILWNAFKRLPQTFSTAARATLFCNTAVRVDRLWR